MKYQGVLFTMLDQKNKEPCAVCAKTDWPQVGIHLPKGERFGICVECLGNAIENVTHWNINSLFDRWRKISPLFGDFKSTMKAAAGIKVKNPRVIRSKSKTPKG